MKKTVIVVEDDERLRNHLVKILKTASDIECLAAIQSAEEALERVPKLKPDIVVMDIKLPGMSGIECVHALKHKIPALEILMLTVYAESDIIFRALKAGATGYLLKSSKPKAILDAIRDVYTGGAPFSAPIARKVVHYFQSSADSNREGEGLSPREVQLLELLALGFTNKEISEKMNITLESARTYVKRICTKMHVRNRLEAVIKHRSWA